MPPAQKWSTLKKECKALGTLDGSLGDRICINGKYYDWQTARLELAFLREKS